MLTMLQKKGRGSKAWAVRQGKLTEIHLHLLRIIHLEISIQNISLVLSCESHPKCKSKATNNCIKRTLHKVNNPCTRKYKHRFIIPGGNSTSPSLMFLSLKLDIRGLCTFNCWNLQKISQIFENLISHLSTEGIIEMCSESPSQVPATQTFFCPVGCA